MGRTCIGDRTNGPHCLHACTIVTQSVDPPVGATTTTACTNKCFRVHTNYNCLNIRPSTHQNSAVVKRCKIVFFYCDRITTVPWSAPFNCPGHLNISGSAAEADVIWRWAWPLTLQGSYGARNRQSTTHFSRKLIIREVCGKNTPKLLVSTLVETLWTDKNCIVQCNQVDDFSSAKRIKYQI